MRALTTNDGRTAAVWYVFSAALLFVGTVRPLPHSTAQTDELTAQEKRGKEIYLRGVSPSGKTITASLGDDVQLPASTVACSNCHGQFGRGKPEGGVDPSPLTWESLTKPYAITTNSGRKRPPYTESLLKRAIAMGIDSSGNKLQPPMPRFQMSIEDISDLVAYLKRLGTDSDTGLTNNTIRLAILSPAASDSGPLVQPWKAVNNAIAAYLDEVNRSGGVYGRTIELAMTGNGSNEEFQGELDRAEAFAMISAFSLGADGRLAAVLEDRGTPAVIAFPPLIGALSPPLIKSRVFFLYSGFPEQTRALCQFVAGRPSSADARVSVAAFASVGAGELIAAVEDQCRKLSLQFVWSRTYGETDFDAEALVGELTKAGSNTVLFLGPATQTMQFLRAAHRLAWFPAVLTLGAVQGEEIFKLPETFKGKVFEVFPTLPADWSQDKIEEYAELAKKHNLSRRHLAAQLSGLAAAAIVVSVLKYVGKDLSREKFVAAMEKLYDYKTGLTPPLSYSPSRRVGAMGAYVVSVDPDKKDSAPQGTWVIPISR